MSVLFDLEGNGFQGWIPAFVTAVAAVFLLIVVAFAFVRYDRSDSRRATWAVAGAIGFTFFALVTAFDLRASWRDYNQLLTAYKRGEYTVVSGVVSDYHHAEGGHGDDWFVVGTRRFVFSTATETPAYHGEFLGSPPLRDGQNVRVFAVGDAIVRLELVYR